MPPPTSTALPSGPLPVHLGRTSKARLATLAGTETIVWTDPIGLRVHVATIGAHSATSLTVNAAAAPGGHVTYDLTGDGTAELPIIVADP